MNKISRDERKKQKGIKKLLNSFTYPIKGQNTLIEMNKI